MKYRNISRMIAESKAVNAARRIMTKPGVRIAGATAANLLRMITSFIIWFIATAVVMSIAGLPGVLAMLLIYYSIASYLGAVLYVAATPVTVPA